MVVIVVILCEFRVWRLRGRSGLSNYSSKPLETPPFPFVAAAAVTITLMVMVAETHSSCAAGRGKMHLNCILCVSKSVFLVLTWDLCKGDWTSTEKILLSIGSCTYRCVHGHVCICVIKIDSEGTPARS